MRISTDELIIFENSFITINGTLLFSWIVMLILISVAVLIRIGLNKKNNDPTSEASTLQTSFEVLISTIESQIKTISSRKISITFPFIATLFIYIVVSNLIFIIPNFESPTGSLSTTAALAICMFIFSIGLGIKEKGFLGYFKKFFKPIPLLMPLNVISDLSRVVSLSMRLYGNITSTGAVIIIFSQIAFLAIGFPIMMDLLGVIGGVIQAYIFSILSLIAISSDN